MIVDVVVACRGCGSGMSCVSVQGVVEEARLSARRGGASEVQPTGVISALERLAVRPGCGKTPLK